VNLLGILFNIFSIIFLGDYNPALVSDGPWANEDSWFYLPAYELAYAIGTINL
jgi:hypothetical protein